MAALHMCSCTHFLEVHRSLAQIMSTLSAACGCVPYRDHGLVVLASCHTIGVRVQRSRVKFEARVCRTHDGLSAANISSVQVLSAMLS